MTKPVTSRFHLPESTDLHAFLEEYDSFQEDFKDLKYLLRGCRGGEEWWEGYFPFRYYWIWKGKEKPTESNQVFLEFIQQIYSHLFQQEVEEAIWAVFLWAITDHAKSALNAYNEGWRWKTVRSAFQTKEEKWQEFCAYIQETLKFKIRALFDPEKRMDVINDYLERTVPTGQKTYFLNLIKDLSNPFDAYDTIYREIAEIDYIGKNVVAPSFVTYLAELRILPIIPSDNVKVSQFVKTAIKNYTGQDHPNYRKTISQLAKKYAVLPSLIERAFHKIGRELKKQEQQEYK